MGDLLCRLVEPVSTAERLRMHAERDFESDAMVVDRAASPPGISLLCVDNLMDCLHARKTQFGDREKSDSWLAPRIHYALRLSRAEASDPGVWEWLAIRYLDYVEWRWSNPSGVAENRYRGPINKQALARLWWGAELFRDGGDYHTAEKAFVFQDFVNSYTHRTITRCRSLAVALVKFIEVPGVGAGKSGVPRTADQINALARTLNLATAGAPPELETALQQDDAEGYRRWLGEDPTIPQDWNAMPVGPDCVDTTEISLAGGRAIADRAWSYAVLRET